MTRSGQPRPTAATHTGKRGSQNWSSPDFRQQANPLVHGSRSPGSREVRAVGRAFAHPLAARRPAVGLPRRAWLVGHCRNPAIRSVARRKGSVLRGWAADRDLHTRTRGGGPDGGGGEVRGIRVARPSLAAADMTQLAAHRSRRLLWNHRIVNAVRARAGGMRAEAAVRGAQATMDR